MENIEKTDNILHKNLIEEGYDPKDFERSIIHLDMDAYYA